MLSTFFYANEKVDRETLTDLFLKVLVATISEPEDGYDDEADLEEGLKGLAMAIQALSPARNKKSQELTGTVQGEEAEKLFRKTWVVAYVATLSRKGFHPENPLDGATGKMNPKDEAQANAFIEAGNSPDWNNPVANGTFAMPRWLVIRAANTMGEIDADRTADFYKFAQAQQAKKDADETRDPETKG